MIEAIGIKYLVISNLLGTGYIYCDLGYIILFVWRKSGLFEASLKVTGTWNNTVQGNASNTCGKNSP